MTVLNQTSLGDQVSKKMSIWILVLVAGITAAVCFVSFFQSRQMFLKQVDSWRIVVPQQTITSLIDSDHFSIQREVNFLKSTGLFSSFCITDNQKRMIASFGKQPHFKGQLIPIQDDAKVIWGYYFLETDFYKFFAPFLISALCFLVLIVTLYFLIKWRIKLNLETEFSRFNQFLSEVELVTEKIHDIYNDENTPTLNINIPYSSEQVIINKSISRLLDEIKKANKSLREAISMAEQKRFQDELTATALQVVHDIGSPLATLEAIVQSASLMLPEESRVAIRNAAIKMRDITNSLLKKAKRDLLSTNDGMITQHLLYSLINQVLTEKRLQYRDKSKVHIHFDFNQSSYGFFAMLKVAEFSRVLSNIINNAVESLDSKPGEILISLLSDHNHCIVQIKDNGKGIPNEVLSRLGQLGLTYGKANGHGLGLFHAKTTIENWGGVLKIQSQLGKGTTVSICLPKSQPPIWFLPKLITSSEQVVVIIDDDEAIHTIWKQRFKSVQIQSDQSLQLFHFYSPEEFTQWNAEGLTFNNILYLCDYEFIGSKENGIDLITQLRLNIFSVLVTNRFYTDEVIMACESAGIKILPKDMASIVPIEII